MLEAKEVYSFLLFVNGWLGQLFTPCSQPVFLSTSSLNTRQYLGKWYFIAAASVKESDVQMFRQMDSTVFHLNETSEKALLLTGAMRMGGHCVMKNWTYTIQSVKDYFTSQGRPELQTSVEWRVAELQPVYPAAGDGASLGSTRDTRHPQQIHALRS
ncbi:apolipoprotein M-like [Oncorhynchus masou masou]|uniref:apolipoprotein M-like n=1 Tax=Oncorhynchus masou masou TaxID=90313 RepID=UPI003183194E